MKRSRASARPRARAAPPVRAYVVLKGPAGGAVSARAVSAKTVAGYVAGSAAQARAKEALAELGLRVVRASGLSVVVEGGPEVFERVFRVRPEQGHGQSWSWSGTPRVPDSLSSLVDTVVLPQPTALVAP